MQRDHRSNDRQHCNATMQGEYRGLYVWRKGASLGRKHWPTFIRDSRMQMPEHKAIYSNQILQAYSFMCDRRSLQLYERYE